jgi:hypothetical protein
LAHNILSGKQEGRDWSCGIEEMGSVFTPTSILNKVDDLRYDVRNVGANVAGGIYALAGAFAFLAFAKMYRATSSAASHHERKAS